MALAPFLIALLTIASPTGADPALVDGNEPADPFDAEDPRVTDVVDGDDDGRHVADVTPSPAASTPAQHAASATRALHTQRFEDLARDAAIGASIGAGVGSVGIFVLFVAKPPLGAVEGSILPAGTVLQLAYAMPALAGGAGVFVALALSGSVIEGLVAGGMTAIVTQSLLLVAQAVGLIVAVVVGLACGCGIDSGIAVGTGVAAGGVVLAGVAAGAAAATTLVIGSLTPPPPE